MSVTFYNWQAGLQPGVPYTRLSPNLVALREELGKRFGGYSLGGYGVRPIRGSTTVWSSHSFGAAIDWRLDDNSARAAAMAWLVDHHAVLGVQAVHDYFGCRIWRANRYPGQPTSTWWRPQTASTTTGMGQAWAKYLHVETDRSNWSNTTPVSQRLDPTPPTDSPLVFDPARGLWGTWPTDPAKPRLTRTDTSVDTREHDATRYLQGVLRYRAGLAVAVDGDYGPKTEAAVRAFQQARGLTVDGVVGVRQTWPAVDRLAGQ